MNNAEKIFYDIKFKTKKSYLREKQRIDGQTLRQCKEHGWLPKTTEYFFVAKQFGKIVNLICRKCIQKRWRLATKKKRDKRKSDINFKKKQKLYQMNHYYYKKRLKAERIKKTMEGEYESKNSKKIYE